MSTSARTTYRDDPRWQQVCAVYFEPGAHLTATARKHERDRAVQRMYEIEMEYEEAM